MTWVKVCGLRTPAEVEVAATAGADAVGLVLAPSPRQIDLALARRLVAECPVLSVLVTVDSTPDELLAAVDATGAGGVQPHGRHAEAAATAASQRGLFVLRPIRVAEKRPDLDVVPLGQTPLLDAYDAGRHGGTGTPFDWGLVSTNRPYVLAGGLGPDNVAEAVASAAPWGVDASSGLESSPGVKDPARIRAFVEGAKA